MNYMSEEFAILATIDPDALTAATHTSDWVDMTEYQQIMAIVMVGALGASATVDAKLEQATDSSGTGAKDLDGVAPTPVNSDITQLTQAGTDDDKQVIINVNADRLDVANDFTHVRLSMTVGTATSDGAGIILGRRSRSQPATNNDLGSVDEIVTVA